MPIEAPPRTFDPRTAEPASEKPADVLEAFVVNQVAASHQNASAGRFRCGAGIGTMPLIAEKFAGPRGGARMDGGAGDYSDGARKPNLRGTGWWSWQDSNLQPSDYEAVL
jgi:hypothetical protein